MANTSKEKQYKLPEGFDAEHFASFLLSEKVITVVGIGTFELIKQKSYMGKIPSSKEKQMIHRGYRIKFRPTRQLKQKMKDYDKN